MARNLACAAVLAASVALASCGRGSSREDAGTSTPDAAAAPLVVVAGMVQVDAVEDEGWADGVDLARLGIGPGEVDAYYDLTTPADAAFLFDIVSRAEGNAGPVCVSVAHAQEDGNTPVGGPESMGPAGIVPSAPGAVSREPWLEAVGDGFSRISLRGAVKRDQVFAVRSRGEEGGRPTTALVRLRLGEESAINLATSPGTDYPGVEETRDLYSSNSWAFGLPTAAVSGDRTTVVVYEGDRADPDRYDRYEMRLQLDHAGGAVTGGAAEEASPDSGNWRDHEIAGLFNTLALVRGGSDAVTVRLSFDRGATFAQEERLALGDEGFYTPRLVQIAMAADYSLAVLFWRRGKAGTTDLVLFEGRPSAYDGGGSPERYAFEEPRVLRRVAGDVTPVILGACWSDGGDLVAGYGYTSFTSNADGTWRSLTESRCAVILFGSEEVTDTLVEAEEIVGRDPSVAVLGSGATMRILYAYEGREGVRLRVSDDAGKNFGAARSVGDASASMPTVLARVQGGVPRVDLLYLSAGAEGRELRVLHWDDFGGGAPVDHRLTTAETIESANAPPDRPVPGADMGILPPDTGWRVREIAWFGYDATLEGDDVVVVYDEVTTESGIMWLGGRGRGPAFAVFLDGAAEGGFAPAEPPPLKPGLTDPVAPPDPAHMHQLKWMRLD